MRKWWLAAITVALGGTAYLWWNLSHETELPEGIAGSNGRIEAVEIDIAAKTPGRLVDVFVDEGEFVTKGQVVAQMDTDVLQAQLREAQAELRSDQTAVEAAKSSVVQRENEATAAKSVVAQRDAELDRATKSYERAQGLIVKSAIAAEDLDAQRAAFFSAKAAVDTAKAQVAAAQAAISTAQSHVIQAEASVEAKQAKVERIQADIKDSTLKSPRDGRVQYRVAEPGEVLSAGGKVLNLIDLGDVYMTFFLPTASAGRLTVGSEARIIVDAAPQYVIPAKVSYVADVAQFTPKTVETVDEREKLMFRIKAHIDPELLKKYIRAAKTGLPGMAYVKFDERTEWPEHLKIKLP